MELPNDLIKATNYSKAKEREIHEFEYVNGKYIHRYVLGGEHEMTPQEIVDCLNAIATIDCDLSTAYAYIKGQDEKIAELKQKAIVPKFKIGQEVFYIAPKRQIVKAIVIGCFENGLIVKCKNRNFIKLLNENIFSSEENAKTSIEKYYKDIPKNYQRNKLNNVYWKMKERCYNPKSLSYINYGAVGITMCDEWKNSYNEFKTWAENNGYKEDIMPNGRNRLTLDRIDNSKGYCPSNCRWVTQKEQQNNKRNNRKAKLRELQEK